MNGWDQLLLWLSFVTQAVIVVIIGVIIFGILVGLWRGIKGWFKPKKDSVTTEEYMMEAHELGHRMYEGSASQIEAFRAGARWAWAWHRKQS